MSKARIIIYGVAQQAQQLRHYIELEDQGTIIAHVIDDAYKQAKCPDMQELNGVPVICFSEMIGRYAPEEVFVANSLAYSHMVADRERVHKQCKAEGYRMFTFISKAANVYAAEVGEGTIIYPGCMIGYHVRLGEGNFIDVSTTIAHDSVVGPFNFFAPNVTLCGGIHVADHCFIGAGAVILNGGSLEPRALIAAGAVVRDAEADGVYFAARTTKWHGTSSEIKI